MDDREEEKTESKTPRVEPTRGAPTGFGRPMLSPQARFERLSLVSIALTALRLQGADGFLGFVFEYWIIGILQLAE